MKRIFKPAVITGIYGLIVFIFCFILGFFISDADSVLPPDMLSVKLLAGQSYFMELFPAVLTTGYLIGFALMFGAKKVGGQKSFSKQMFQNFQIALVYAVLFSALAFAADEIGSLNYNHSIESKIIRRRNYAEYIDYTESHMVDGKLDLARYYLKSAWELYPASPEVARLDRELEILLKEPERDVAETDDESVLPVEELSEQAQQESLVYLNDSLKAFEEGRYIDAHYYATLSASVAKKDDANWEQATRIAAMSWNMLQTPTDSINDDEVALFSDKKRGYDSFSRNDLIEAYSIYQQLAEEYPSDPEVQEYFEKSRERLENVFFYTDETYNLQTFESSQNVFFSLENDDGTSADFNIKGITVVEQSSQMIQYLRNLSIINYDKNHMPVSSLYVPYAKMTAVAVTRGNKTQYEPFLTLVSVERENSYDRQYPVYSENRNNDMVPHYLQLPMSYADFNLICKASSGPDGLSLAKVYNFSKKAGMFGYSGQRYYIAFLHRILFPLEIVILLIMMALSGFRYRLLPGRVFKFKWIPLFPILTIVLYVVLNIFAYFFDVIDIVGYNRYGTDFAVIAVLVQMIVLVWVSFLFVSARGE